MIGSTAKWFPLSVTDANGKVVGSGSITSGGNGGGGGASDSKNPTAGGANVSIVFINSTELTGTMGMAGKRLYLSSGVLLHAGTGVGSSGSWSGAGITVATLGSTTQLPLEPTQKSATTQAPSACKKGHAWSQTDNNCSETYEPSGAPTILLTGMP